MKKLARAMAAGLLFSCVVTALLGEEVASRQPDLFSNESIVAVMTRVCDWQLEQPKHYASTDWTYGALYTGIMATYYTTRDEKYLNAMLERGQENEWKPGERPRHADDHCVGQLYTELYFIKKDPAMIAPIRQRFDDLMGDPKRGREDWWWCDALFMAPPVLARLRTATGDEKYLDLMNKMWWDTTEFLYDTEEHLYYRDKRFKIAEDGSGLREANGKKIFWSRGNGWVMAGTVRVLQHMREDYADRAKYVRLLKEMAEKIASIQPDDGLWQSSLLDPASYPNGETSGSGFFCYALAWGVNEEILEKERFLPVIKKAWKGLVGAVDESGKLLWVQKPGDRPKKITKDDTDVYGVGAFLLAGSEVAKLQ